MIPMNRLTLLRHGKSSWDGGEADFDRPLNSRGRRDAPLMGRICRERLPEPELILLSPSRRTGETVELFTREWGLSGVDIRAMDRLYLAGLPDWITVIETVRGRGDHILACAHQPGVELFARWLDPSFRGDVPTCGVISLVFTGDFGVGGGSVDFYGKPGDFR